MPSSLAARFQPYTLSLFDSHSAGGFTTRQLITFRSHRSRRRFIRFLRRKCRARRRGNWASIPGYSLVTRAIEYAARHGSFVYDLPVRKTPGARRSSDVMSDSEGDDSTGEDVAEADIPSDAEDL